MKLPLFAISTLSQPYYFFTTTLLLGNVKIDYKYDEYFRWKCDKQKSWGNVGGFHISIFIQPSRKTDVDEENKRMMDENEDEASQSCGQQSSPSPTTPLQQSNLEASAEVR